MKLKYLAVAVIILAFAGSAFAQEGETQVVDEVVAQVNDGNLTIPTVLFRDGSALTNPSVAQVGSPAEILADPADDFVHDLRILLRS